eukprot:TRINITY_DN1358_c0_g1_i3.p1 TRINITY_DN1358_c0_g1~~TRINITY_DN1358_c0_g1_i3.p1  ORF type:complete len:648 (+),score=151.61 TRINITY_DN1358_c0_g1_i3:493-2436(+)
MVCAEWHRLSEGSQPLPTPDSDTDDTLHPFASNNEGDRTTTLPSQSFSWSRENRDWMRQNYSQAEGGGGAGVRRYSSQQQQVGRYLWSDADSDTRSEVLADANNNVTTPPTSLFKHKHRLEREERTERPHKRPKLTDKTQSITTTDGQRRTWERQILRSDKSDEEEEEPEQQEEEEEACIPDCLTLKPSSMATTTTLTSANNLTVKSTQLVTERVKPNTPSQQQQQQQQQLPQTEQMCEDGEEGEGEREGEEECDAREPEDSVTAEDIENSIKGLNSLLDPLAELQDKTQRFEELLLQMREVRDMKDEFKPLVDNVSENLRLLKKQISERKSFFALLQGCAVPPKVHLGYFGLLPAELIYAIFEFVGGKELSYLAQVCTLFFGIAQEESLWKALSERLWAPSIELGQKPESRNWKWLFKAKMHNYRQGEVRSGVGRFVLPYGNLYEGEWKDNLRHGQGTGIMKDGRRYDGQWENDMRSGFGIFRWPIDCGANGGDMYVGEWKKSKRHGRGVYTWVDGTRYDGSWGDGKREGVGCVVWPDGRKYVGEYRDGKMEGRGTFTWPDSSVYVGEYRNGKRHGRGKYIYAKGGQYDGEWEGGMRQGYGVLLKSTGEKYEGQWRYNAPWGLGVVTYKDGRRVEKYWTEEELLME